MSLAAVKTADRNTSTARPELDEHLTRLRSNAQPWARSPIRERIELAHRLMAGYASIAEELVKAGCDAKGIDVNTPAAYEEWFASPVAVIRMLRQLIETLEKLDRGLSPLPSDKLSTDGERVIGQVFPGSTFDKLLFTPYRGEVWFEKGLTKEQVLAKMGEHYKTPVESRAGKICLVLGAGNVASIPPLDVMTKLFNEGTVCILKMNPVNAHVGPFVERGFAAAIEKGLLAVVYGGGDVGGYLTEHKEVDEVHITGSDKTHDLLVWGADPAEQKERKAKKQPKLTKHIGSELGNISPVIIVPGPYSEKELEYQGKTISTAVVNNASFNCNAAKLLVQSASWDGRAKFNAAIKSALSISPLRKAYYPGAEDRWNLLTTSHKNVEKVGDAKPGELPWAIISDVDPNDSSEKAFSMEPWCGVLSETALSESDPVKFLDQAVEFVNTKVWGTLAATIVIHPQTLKQPGVAEAFRRALGNLRYGAIGVNVWPGLVYALGNTPWGAHPSSTLEDIQSGLGWVHNTYMLGGIEKAIVFGELTSAPKPVWFPDNKTGHVLGKRMVGFEMDPSWLKLPGLMINAVKG